MTWLIAVFIGAIAGLASGFMGIGGGVVIIPALVFMLGFDQHLAQGTSLAAMVPPIGLLAAYVYYKSGHVDIPVAALIAAGFIVGGMLGARVVVHIDAGVLRKVFGVVLLLLAVRMILD
ncbi:MAG TPA: sulfite exporter TauE/SafE family protein [Spirochaetota bacterium]|nr:sulfite exporter TauE/SafE family protein [Spirochaetota bacterium]OPZ39541.1 MAG: Sulfite exporter TauE/SafE [Spirochaetes bacterium ADurb.BinA120]HNU91105.1 sulfite exporter TauE/SafE family protein [Spirochaetota bacterium]HPI14121.1 sulfite exporter TauE/SafE family protein [Spirochaetota bacterium]HPO45166.1 sulfite exporter TauE/SafE family protein [Spirochaetota bacterium]